MIYLDNASTTNKKPLCVKLAVLKSLSKKYCANPGRSAHKLSINSAEVIFKTRVLINEMFNNSSVENVVFTGSCTEALNTAIYGTVKEKGNVITTSNEHNSVIRPLKYLESLGKITVTIVEANESGVVTAEMLEKEIKKETYLIVTNHISNVTGACADVRKIGKMCRKNKLIYMVDGAQSAGHKKIDMIKDNINILCLAGHKGLLAPQGIGVLLFRDVEILPLKRGGTGTHSEEVLPPNELPESLEAGTNPSPNIFGLYAGAKYVKKHFEKINKNIENLTKFFYEELSKLKDFNIYTPKNEWNGVVSFTSKKYPPNELVNLLNDYNICVRSGLHCAPLVHARNGTDKTGGMIRVSIGHNNKKRELKKLLKILKDLDSFMEIRTLEKNI